MHGIEGCAAGIAVRLVCHHEKDGKCIDFFFEDLLDASHA